MNSELQILLLTAIGIAFLHTLSGPDHYLPFIALAKARNWSFLKTLGWTLLCGAGHVLSSILLGLIGATVGWSLSKLTFFEEIRGGLAGWLLLSFGIIYGIWGLWRAFNNGRHKHFEIYGQDEIYVYEHRPGQVVQPSERHKVTPWVMFIIFLLGPCEPMIPLLYFPAAQRSLVGMMLMIGTYTLVTLATMSAMVVLGYFGVSFLNASSLEKYMHALGGLTITICGLGMVFLEW